MGKHWETLQKELTKPNAASHNTTSRYTDTDGFLEHSPSGESPYNKGPTLQKIILGFGEFPPHIYWIILTYLEIYFRHKDEFGLKWDQIQ